MTTAETAVINKYLTEIEAAAPEVRAAIVSEASQFLAFVEKRINLTRLEASAESFLGKVEGEVASAVDAVEAHL